MNPKFYSLPKEKQSAILNAGFHVFSQNTYKKSPMSEIADAVCCRIVEVGASF